jgi:hypothetical protein
VNRDGDGTHAAKDGRSSNPGSNQPEIVATHSGQPGGST